jgi:truncated hemoglobin YjbI
MVHEFYSLVLEDEILAPFFIKALGDDMSGGKWHEHLHRLDEFWLLLMGHVSTYQGDPTPAHAFIGQMTPESFERWLELFHGVVNRLYIPEIADKLHKKAQIVAAQLRENLGVDDDDDDW